MLIGYGLWDLITDGEGSEDSPPDISSGGPCPNGDDDDPENKRKNQIKRLSEREIKALKEKGIDPHELKPNSKYDLFKNQNGDIQIRPKNGTGPGDPTGLNIKDFL